MKPINQPLRLEPTPWAAAGKHLRDSLSIRLGNVYRRWRNQSDPEGRQYFNLGKILDALVQVYIDWLEYDHTLVLLSECNGTSEQQKEDAAHHVSYLWAIASFLPSFWNVGAEEVRRLEEWLHDKVLSGSCPLSSKSYSEAVGLKLTLLESNEEARRCEKLLHAVFDVANFPPEATEATISSLVSMRQNLEAYSQSVQELTCAPYGTFVEMVELYHLVRRMHVTAYGAVREAVWLINPLDYLSSELT